MNYELKEKVNTYCFQIQKIQNNLNEIINEQVISEPQKDYDKIDVQLNLKLEKMVNDIKENVKHRVNQLKENLIDFTKKSKSLKNQSLIEEVPNPENIFKPEIPIVKYP